MNPQISTVTTSESTSESGTIFWDVFVIGLIGLLALTSVPILMDMPERVMRRFYLFGFLVAPPAVGLVGLQMMFGRKPEIDDPALMS